MMHMRVSHCRPANRLDNFFPALGWLTEIDRLWNTSLFDFKKLLEDTKNLADNLRTYLFAHSP